MLSWPYMRAGCSGDKAEATKARTLGKVRVQYATGYRWRNIDINLFRFSN